MALHGLGKDLLDIPDGELSTKIVARWARKSTGLDQVSFATKYGLPLSTFRRWEQGLNNAGSREMLVIYPQSGLRG